MDYQIRRRKVLSDESMLRGFRGNARDYGQSAANEKVIAAVATVL